MRTAIYARFSTELQQERSIEDQFAPSGAGAAGRDPGQGGHLVGHVVLQTRVNATGANYSTDYKEFQGIKMPTTRRVYAYDENGQKIPDPLLVSIDIETIVFS